MEKIYRSKVDLWIEILLVLLLVFSVLIPSGGEQQLLGIAITVGVTLIVEWMLRSTRYVVRDGTLVVKTCFVSYGTWSIADIESIRPTHNPLSAPASSLDRLEIRFSRRRTLLVSPRHKQEFINHLVSLNPAIKVL